MEKSTKVWIGLVGVAIVGVGGYLYYNVSKLIKATFKVNGVKDVNISGSNISFTLISKITNNGNISAYVNDQYYDVFINDKLVSRVHNKGNVFVGADKTSIIPLKVDLKLNELVKIGLENLTNIVTDKSKVKFSIKGYFKWRAGILAAKQPFELSYTLKEIVDLKNTPST